MKSWKRPEIWGLSFRDTKGNPGVKGNDQYIPDCIEFFTDFIIPTGPVPFTPSGICNVAKEYTN
ncbi:hypothetical protein [Clostridium thermarum]|nr:hypothetical protein [Clostridium thermarum]